MNRLTIAADRLARLRRICLALPEACEVEAWGDPTWRIGKKIFAMQKGNYEGGEPSIWLKADIEAQAQLIEANPKVFFVPPYVGHKGWVGARMDTKSVPWPLLAELIETSYRLIAPKKLAARIGETKPIRGTSKKTTKKRKKR
jgi:hypothetical protein